MPMIAFYAATLPLEANQLLFSQCATEENRNVERLQLSFVDIKKGFCIVCMADIYMFCSHPNLVCPKIWSVA